MHLCVVGVGKIGRETAYTLLSEGIFEELSLVDIVPGLAEGFKQELRHVCASLCLDVEINAFERCGDVSGADIVLISAGKPRTADMKRADLAEVNAKIIKSIAEEIYPKNKGARFIIVTNPVDALATLFKYLTGAEHVISSGCHLDSIRLRAELASHFGTSIRDIEAYVGGEHGPKSVILWSLTRVKGLPAKDYARLKGVEFDESKIEELVKESARKIIASTGATQYGPAAAFRDIVKAMALNESRVLSIAPPRRFDFLPVEVCVSVPVKVGWTLGPDLWSALTEDEKKLIEEAARSVYNVFKIAAKAAGIEV